MDRPDGRLNAWILAWDVAGPAPRAGAPVRRARRSIRCRTRSRSRRTCSCPRSWSAPASGPGRARARLQPGRCSLRMVVSGLGTQLLVRRASGDRLAAFVGGALFAAGAHRWIRLAHLHAQVTLFLPLALLRARPLLASAARCGRALGRRPDARAAGAVARSTSAAITALALASPRPSPGRLAACGPREMRRARGRRRAGRRCCWRRRAPVPAHARVRGRRVDDRGRRDATRPRSTSYAASGTRLYGRLTQRHLDPAVVQDTLFPGLVRAGARRRRPRRGAAPLPRRSGRVLARPRSWSSRSARRRPPTASCTSTSCSCAACARCRASRCCPCWRCPCSPGLALAGRRRLAGARARAVPRRVDERARSATHSDAGAAGRDRWLAGRSGAVVRAARSGDGRHGGHARRRPRTGGRSSTATPASCPGRTRARWSCSTARFTAEAPPVPARGRGHARRVVPRRSTLPEAARFQAGPRVRRPAGW